MLSVGGENKMAVIRSYQNHNLASPATPRPFELWLLNFRHSNLRYNNDIAFDHDRIALTKDLTLSRWEVNIPWWYYDMKFILYDMTVYSLTGV